MHRIGLALAGGGARGAYQIGAWKAFKEYGIDKLFVAYSGASVGSLNATLFAMDDYDKAHDLWMSLDRDTLFNLEKQIFKRLFKEKLNFLNRGVYSTKRLEKLIESTLDYELIRKKDVFVATTYLGNEKSTFFDLLRTNYKHYFKSENQIKYQNLRTVKDNENIKKTLMASCAIPIIFRPIEIASETFYDGGILDNTPFQPLIDYGCDVVIVIDLFKITFVKPESPEGVKLITVHPKKSLRGVLDFNQKYIKRRFELGYQDTLVMIENNKEIFGL